MEDEDRVRARVATLERSHTAHHLAGEVVRLQAEVEGLRVAVAAAYAALGTLRAQKGGAS